MRDVRLLPLVIAAIGGLLLLKAVGLVTGVGPGAAGPAWAQEGEAVEQAENIEVAGEADGASPSREAVLGSLSERREELEARAQELQLRENLLKAAEMRVEERIAELREIETRLKANEEARSEEDEERFAGLVTMYEAMKPKDAARIFNRLDMAILVRVVRGMNARKMAEVLAAMEADVAQRLTVELSAESPDPLEAVEAQEALPKIVGTRPAG